MSPPIAPTPIRSVLVANRGEIARRIFRTARSMGMRCIAVFVDADADAPFVQEADEDASRRIRGEGDDGDEAKEDKEEKGSR